MAIRTLRTGGSSASRKRLRDECCRRTIRTIVSHSCSLPIPLRACEIRGHGTRGVPLVEPTVVIDELLLIVREAVVRDAVLRPAWWGPRAAAGLAACAVDRGWLRAEGGA